MPLRLIVPDDIDQRLVGLGDAIARASAGIDFAYVFGSVSTNRRSTRSDVDIAIHAAEGIDGQFARLEVARAAAKHLSTDAIDVVLLNTAPISLAGRVLVDRRVVLDRKPFARHRYESRIARMFQDFRVREHRLLTARYGHG
ncbi:MAG: hypothetical protein GEV06_20100 [Luteitalea sp.]|nr:hypothetical protein [Luteitalea sp.]